MRAPARNVKVVTVRTTLYELIEALSDVVESGDETLVHAVLLDLMDSGRMRTTCSLDFSDHTQLTMTPARAKIDKDVRRKGRRHV